MAYASAAPGIASNANPEIIGVLFTNLHIP
jgi:hypothetical protein